MNKVDKFLLRIPKADREKILRALNLIVRGTTRTLDVKKLKGISDRYRVRVGIYRIQFETDRKGVYIIDISKRDDTTYNS